MSLLTTLYFVHFEPFLPVSLAPADSQQMEDIFNEEFTIGIVHSEEIQSAGNAAEAAVEADSVAVDDGAAASAAADHTGNVLGNYHHYLSSLSLHPL